LLLTSVAVLWQQKYSLCSELDWIPAFQKWKEKAIIYFSTQFSRSDKKVVTGCD